MTRILACALPDEPQTIATSAQIHTAIGLHPVWVAKVSEEQRQEGLSSLVSKLDPKVHCAVGEFGFDKRFKDQLPFQAQEAIVRAHLDLAQKYTHPVVLHVVGRHQQMLETLDDYPELVGMVHGFSGSLESARMYSRRGFKIGISGRLCRSGQQKLERVAKELPLDALLLETDSPDQHPVPKSSSMNEPANVVAVAKALAEIRGIPVQEVGERTTQNFCELFGS